MPAAHDLVSPKRRPARLARGLSLAFVALLSILGVAPVAANHVQMESGRVIVFDHAGGNEWWVELAVSGHDAGQVSGMQVASYPASATMWKPMTWHPEWSKWTASIHVPPGDPVKFRASWAGGAMHSSCWFSHPQGQEACGGPGGTTFDATFTGMRGNEWWVQASVATNGPTIASVDARMHSNGAWSNSLPVTKQSWGWGSSYHVTQGTIVQLRATASDGQSDLSSCRQWVPASGQDAVIVTCPGAGSGTPPPFDATFTGVKGNEWWVQVNVAGNQPVTGVAFRVNCAPDWTDLPRQSWGGYAYGYHIPPGSVVDFQARTSIFASDVSGGYVWTSASPTTACAIGDWPRQGSTATYAFQSGVCGGGNCENSQAELRMRYDHGRWINTCYGTNNFIDSNGQETHESWTTDNSGLAPISLPTKTQAGAQHRPYMFSTSFTYKQCGEGWISSPVTVVDQQDLLTTANRDANGNPVTVRTWHARSDGADGNNIYEVHWDTKLGMVLDINSNPRMSGQGSSSMYLTETSAPLKMGA